MVLLVSIPLSHSWAKNTLPYKIQIINLLIKVHLLALKLIIFMGGKNTKKKMLLLWALSEVYQFPLQNTMPEKRGCYVTIMTPKTFIGLLKFL